jgi:hypothetical protein
MIRFPWLVIEDPIMDAPYCPTSRTFYWLRSVLMRELGLDRHAIRPSQALADLIPEDSRRKVWRQLRRDGLALPPLRVSWRLRWLSVAHVLHAAFEFAAWCNHVLGLVVAFPLGLLAYATTRQQAVHVDRRAPVTVRDAVLYLTNFREHYRARYRSSSLHEAIAAGYRPSRKEIELQVRLIVAANLGIPLERVTLEMSFTADLSVR